MNSDEEPDLISSPARRQAELRVSDEAFEELKRKAKRRSPDDIVEANLLLFEALGLDLDDVERMAEVVDLEAIDLLLLDRHVGVTVTGGTKRPRRGKRGRPKTHEDIADFANSRREHGKTGRQIYDEWKTTFPKDKRVKSVATIREAHRRCYGDKSRKGY